MQCFRKAVPLNQETGVLKRCSTKIVPFWPLLWLCVLLCACSQEYALSAQPGAPAQRDPVLLPERDGQIDWIVAENEIPWTISQEDQENLTCLRSAYPELRGVLAGTEGLWLLFEGDRRVFYGPWQDAEQQVPVSSHALDCDVRTSMQQPYPPEPLRPETPEGVAPGRQRPYALFSALYGDDAAGVKRRLTKIVTLRRSWFFTPAAAEAFLRAAKELERLAADDPSLWPWLVGSGSFYWRLIAQERVLSAHAFGIAFDIGVRRGAAYWRWCPLRPHPLQKTFPSSIVNAFEKQGFIWGGKWHEYDIMHFEYRPELLCLARKRQAPVCRPQSDGQDGAASQGAGMPSDTDGQ